LKPSKKTTTIPNRFTTSIPNWWAKAAFLLPVLFFVFACEEEFSLLGFKTKKAKVNYAEIPIESTVLWMDSLRTSNSPEGTVRLLAGRYNDPVFGQTEAKAFMQFRTFDLSRIITSSSEYDSVVLQLRYDFYCYGTDGQTDQTFSVHELTDTLSLRHNYFSNSNIDYNPSPIGYVTSSVNKTFFKTEFDDSDKDSLITVKVKLADLFGQRLFSAINYEDINYTYFDLFKNTFKGLAVVPGQSDKIVGFNPEDDNSLLILYYHDGADKKTLSFSFSEIVRPQFSPPEQKVASFSKISTNRSASELSELNTLHTDFDPGLKRYIQGGSSIITKLDFSKFYSYTDTIPTMIINSAELEITNVESSADLTVPKQLSISLLNANNRFRVLASKDSTEYIAFNSTVLAGEDGNFFVTEDDRQLFTIDYSSTNNTYSGFPTFFFQKISELKPKKYLYWALRSSNPSPGKSVDRLVFPKDKIKLKIYYTQPILENQ
jgi:Domain of unknown function (DUF4270)